jgi:Secretion system C-terminal sorting domain
MKRQFTLFALGLLCSCSLTAQTSNVKQLPVRNMKHVPESKAPAKTGFEAQDVSVPASYMATQSRSALEVEIGHSFYDLQTNGSMMRRVLMHPDEHISATFTYSNVADGAFADRGTAYNSSNAALVFGPTPTARIETVRTGFGNLVQLDNGTEVSVAHPAAGGPVVARKQVGATTWTQKTLATPANLLWFRAAADKQNVHIIGITTPVANMGTIYAGVDGHLLYYRSKNGGISFDKEGVVIPGIDSTLFKSLAGDSYAIDAQDGKVAIAIFSNWNDSVVFESTDNGDTWTKHIVFDFPLDNYVADQGYTVNDIPADPNMPDDETDPSDDGLSVKTSDGSGSVLIDDAGVTHVIFGTSWVIDIDLGDGNSNFWSPITGLNYTNSLDYTKLTTITGPLDLNGNDTLDMSSASYEAYGGAATESYPMLSMDGAGRLTLLYSGALEGTADANGKHFRHIYRMMSPDLGTTWTNQEDLITEETVGDQVLADLTEANYVSAPRRSPAGKLCLTYQADYLAGTGVQDQHADEDNFIRCFCIATTVGTETVTAESMKFVINPNPSDLAAQVSFSLTESAQGNIEVLNLTGQVVTRTTAVQYGSGINQVSVNTTNLPNGMYFMRLNMGERSSTRKMVVAH